MTDMDSATLGEVEMSSGAQPRPEPFALSVPFRRPVARRLATPVVRAVGRLLGLGDLDGVYRRVTAGGEPLSPIEFFSKSLIDLGITVAGGESLARYLPASGPVVVVANHPYGAIEGVVLGEAIGRLRPDVKLMANHLLGRIPELRPGLIMVDPFGTRQSTRRNLSPLRECLRWLRDGHVLVIFPAGEVAHPRWPRERGVTDPPWNASAAALARSAGASVLPVFFPGGNSAWFHAAGLVHPRLRTVLLPRELGRLRGRTITLQAGKIVSATRLAGFADAEEATGYLRMRTYLLRHRLGGQRRFGRRRRPAAGGTTMVTAGLAIAPPLPAARLACEVAALPAEQILARSGDLVVAWASAAQIPTVLNELGRLREITFRAVGEGTGQPLDLDRFDQHYLHLFVWHPGKQEVVGAYRMGLVDRLLAEHGLKGIYTASLFKYRRDMVHALGPALELGRSFVRAEYQRSYAPLLLLWRGISEFILRHPQYHLLLGPVSISSAYHSMSRHLLVAFLRLHHRLPHLAGRVRPRHPWRAMPWHRASHPLRQVRHFADMGEMEGLISDIEADGKGVPILLKQYLKLGGKFLAFNVDPQFNRAVDGLVLVDVLTAPVAVMERYMGRVGFGELKAWHAARRLGAAVEAPSAGEATAVVGECSG